jgi:chemotaxis protein MotB
MSRRKKKQEEEHENMERWLVSYADFITLLFAFFVTMYAFSRVDDKKFGSMAESMHRALGSTVITQTAQRELGVLTIYPSRGKPIEVRVAPQLELGGEEAEAFRKLVNEIQKKMKEASAGKGGAAAEVGAHQIEYIIDARGLVIRFAEQFFFDSGEAAIRPGVMPLLNGLGETLAKLRNHIRIEGHTDSVPIHTASFPSNWELSTARATTIVRYMLGNFQFGASQLSAAGYAEFRPIASNKTPAGRMQNRRVDVVVLSGKEMGTEPSDAAGKEAMAF